MGPHVSNPPATVTLEVDTSKFVFDFMRCGGRIRKPTDAADARERTEARNRQITEGRSS